MGMNVSSFFEIESQSISGYLKTLDNSKDYDEKIINIDFTWNYIAINNLYYLIDLASGAGFLYNANYKNERTDFYFGTKPEYFINTHYPNDSKWQLLSQNYSFEKFDSLPYIYYNFYLFGFETFSPETKDLNWNEEIKISLTGGESTVNADFLFEMYDNYRREYEIPDDVIKTEEKAEIILKIDKIKNPLYILLTDGVYPELILYKVNPVE